MRDFSHRKRAAGAWRLHLLVEQNARAALETANDGYMLEPGCVTRSGPLAELIHDPCVVASYLGSKTEA